MAPAAPTTTTTTTPPAATRPPLAARAAVPLTTAWAPPPSCATAVPVVDGGTCRSAATGCSWFPSGGVTTTRADVNYPYMTAPWAYTSASCLPPGWNGLSYMSPATGCPTGYVTASTSKGLVGTQTSIACCPSNFSSFNAYSGCFGTMGVSAGQTYHVRAQGVSTVTSVESAGRTWRGAVVTASSTLTRTYTAQALVTVLAPPVLLVRDGGVAEDSLALTTPSTTSGTATAGFSLFSLSYVVSIVALVGMAAAALLVLGCLWYCCCRRRPPRRYYNNPRRTGFNNPQPPPVFHPPPLVFHPPPPPPVFHPPRPAPAFNPSRPAPAFNPSRPAPAFNPSRPAPAFNPRPLPIGLFNLPRPAAVPKTVDKSLCKTCQTRCHDAAKTERNGCCSCRDTRTTPQDAVPKAQRIASYCATCRDRWARVGPGKCPARWHLDKLECKHGRAAACSRSATFDPACCLCTDARPGRLIRGVRLATYCAPCAGHWRAQPLTALPNTICCARRGGGCAREPDGLLELLHRSNLPCCACADTRPRAGEEAEVSLADRLAPYCAPCRSFYGGVAPAALPEKWRIRCRHGKKLVSGSAVVRFGSPDRCCCACGDARGGDVSRDQRVAAYCASCRDFWADVPDAACPDEWGLDRCAHAGGVGCGSRRCCGCRDERALVRTLAERVATYCAACRPLWLGRVPRADHPAHWEHGSGLFPTLKDGPRGEDQKPHVAFPLEPKDRYRRMHDQGPRVGAPRFGEEDMDEPGAEAAVRQGGSTASPAVARPQQATSPIGSQGSSSRNFPTGLGAVGPGSGAASRPVSPGQEEYAEKGLCRGAPSFAVLPTTSPIPAEEEAVAPPRQQTSPRPQGESRRTLSRFGSAEWRREQDRRGLQFSKPQFGVLPEV
ncbi:hypothetical protein RB594_000977 [Gaeumannomyces avenae]